MGNRSKTQLLFYEANGLVERKHAELLVNGGARLEVGAP